MQEEEQVSYAICFLAHKIVLAFEFVQVLCFKADRLRPWETFFDICIVYEYHLLHTRKYIPYLS